MPLIRPVSAIGPSITRMGDAAQKANVEVVRQSTIKLHRFVTTAGSRYALRGRSGDKVRLSASQRVDLVGSNRAIVGMVKGVPEGFWHIVEYGRHGGYLVASRTTRAGSARRGGQRGVFRTFETGDSFGQLKPIRTPQGPRQFARPGPHGSIGRPWATAMAAGKPAVANELQAEQFRAQSKAFLSTL